MGFPIEQRVRFRSDVPQYEPQGTVAQNDGVDLLILWDDEHPPTIIPVSEALRKIEKI